MAGSTADGSVVIGVNMDVSEAEKRLAKLRGDIKKTEKEISDMTVKRDEAQIRKNDFASKLEQGRKKLKELTDQMVELKTSLKDPTLSKGVKAELRMEQPKLQQEISEQTKSVNAVQAEWKKANREVNRYNENIDASNQKLDSLKTEAGILTQEIDRSSKAQGLFEKASEASKEAMGRLNKRVLGLMADAFVFNIISRALTAVQQLTMKYIKTNDEARQAIAQLKGALLTLAQPLIEVIIPAFTLLVSILAKIITAVAQFVSMLFGKTLKQSKDGAKALHKEANAIGAVGEAADEAAGSLAGFDEINSISTENAKGAGGGAGGAADMIAPDFSGMIADASLSLLTSLGLLVIGAILTFTGAHILIGIGMMALGAYGIYTETIENPGAVKEALNGWLGEVLLIAGMVAVVIGVVLAFSGINILLGIGLIALGAAAIFMEANIAPDKMKEMLSGWLGTAIIIGGIIAVVLGIILICTQVGLPLGIALLILGVGAIFTGVAAKWNFILEKLKGIWSSISSWWNSGDGPKKFLTIDYWKGLGKDIIDWFLGGLKSAWDGLTSWFNGVWDNLFGNRKVSVGVSGTSSAGNYNSGPSAAARSFPEVLPQSIPALARGAVIPPNREFMAVLGDQHHGNNLEAPEDLIRKIVREEAGGNDNTALLQAILTAIKDGHIIMVDGAVFGRTAIKTINSVNTSAGKQLLLI